MIERLTGFAWAMATQATRTRHEMMVFILADCFLCLLIRIELSLIFRLVVDTTKFTNSLNDPMKRAHNLYIANGYYCLLLELS